MSGDAQINELIELLEDVVCQSCDTGIRGQELDSMAISSYANAIRKLAELGRVRILREFGRRVIATVDVVSGVESENKDDTHGEQAKDAGSISD